MNWRRLMGFAVLMGASSGLAADIRRGDVVVIAAGEVVQDDLYVIARTLQVSGRVEGDVLVMAQTVEVDGLIRGNLMTAASTVILRGTVGGAVRAAAGELQVLGQVGADLIAASGEVLLAPGAKLGGDAYLASGEVMMAGAIAGELRAAAGELELSGQVGEGARLTVERLVLQPGAAVGGDLRYTSEQQAQLPPGATVQGQLIHTQAEPGRAAFASRALLWLRMTVGLFALGLVLVLLFPGFAGSAQRSLRHSPWKSLGLGAAALFGIPLLAMGVLLLGILVGGWWLGLLVLGAWTVAILLCFPLVGAVVGRWLLDRFGREGVHLVLALLLGVALVTLVVQVPVLGLLVVLAIVLFGMGALVLGGLRARQPFRAAQA